MAVISDHEDFLASRRTIERNIHKPHAEIVTTAIGTNQTASVPFVIHPELRAIAAAHQNVSRRFYPAVKRGLDIILSAVLLVILSPLLVLIALVVKCTSPGTIIFRQLRVGQGLQFFTCYKFRSMVKNAEWRLEQDADLKAILATNWKLRADPRATAIGRFLRKTSLDELPQLLNVLKGEMSLIGPRPYLPMELADEFGMYAAEITRVRPGMTGLWQVSGRALLSPHHRIELDRRYAGDVSVSSDARILLKTIKVVLVSHGAF